MMRLSTVNELISTEATSQAPKEPSSWIKDQTVLGIPIPALPTPMSSVLRASPRRSLREKRSQQASEEEEEETMNDEEVRQETI